MEKIIWKPEYSVGVERLDQQHQRIISVINKLIAKPSLFITSRTIAEALSDLNSYVSEHFLLEEKLLGENKYPSLIDHSKKHTEYSQRISDFCLRAVEKDKDVREELLSYLGEWWIGHILHEDMKYKRFFEGKGIR
jgi:hemerythrin-like metal-binding protein